MLSGGLELKGTRAPQKMDVYSHMYYDKKVKQMADNETQVDNVTDRGPKLNKCHEVTRHMYFEESEEVKDKVERKYQKAKAKYGKACLLPEVQKITKD
jgi:tryptophanyl-tRNA synthetase